MEGMKIKLVRVTDSEEHKIDQFFDEVEHIDVEKVAPEIVQGKKDLKLGDKSITEYDALYAELPEKNAVFGRVMLEMVEEANVAVNYPSTAFFIMAKKNYLYYVLHEQDIPAPKTMVVASEKAGRNIERELQPPLVGRNIEDYEETETKKLEDSEDIQGFIEGVEYEEDVLLFHELEEGDKYYCLVAGDQIISVKEGSEDWDFTRDNLKYSNISDTQKEIVRKTVNKIGTDIAEILLVGENVYDVNPNPDLEMYQDVSGKSSFEAVAETIKEQVEEK
ncbi:MAG: glutathione synthase/RimK-type ligase-like ATP-grasp enzyme [Colwellia polaris]|jgi:glutathione synthase/RimK-type ligase-like ATP-grasp enzyme